MDFYYHIKLCQNFKIYFQQFDNTLIKLLKDFDQPDNLMIIKFLLNFYKKMIEVKIENQITVIQDIDIETCVVCNDPSIQYLECLHQICVDCFFKLANEEFYSMKCPICTKEITKDYKMQILGDKYDELEETAMKIFTKKCSKCPKCKISFLFEPGDIDPNIKDEKGKKLSNINAEHYAKNRCKCHNCTNDFCISCSVIPYHIGKYYLIIYFINKF